MENDLEIIPVLNKVDLPSANPKKSLTYCTLGCAPEDVIPASAKTGLGIQDILTAIIDRIPAHKGSPDEPLQALIFDSVYNPFRGVETYFRVINGKIRKGQKIQFIATQKTYNADEIGTLKLKQEPRQEITAGDVGYLITGIKEAKEVKVGDTITAPDRPTQNAIEGYEEVKPMVFAGIYPVDTEDYEELRASMEKLQLNDASLVFQPESSAALGFGFRCGFRDAAFGNYSRALGTWIQHDGNYHRPQRIYQAYTKKEPDTIIMVNNPSIYPSLLPWIV